MADAARRTNIFKPYLSDIYEKLIDIFLLYICVCFSEQLVGNILLGGALCLAWQVLAVFVRLNGRRTSELLPPNMQARGVPLLIASFLLLAALLFLYPTLTEHPHFSLMIVCILVLLVQHGAAEWISRRLRVRRLWRALVLIFIHAAGCILLFVLLRTALTGAQADDLFIMLATVSIAAFTFQITIIPPPRKRAQANVKKLLNVSAYNVYNRMVSNIAVALNISLLTYACMARIDATSSMLDMFLDTVLWLILVAGCTIVVLQFFRRRSLTQYDKPTVFIAGAVMLGFAITGTYRDWFAGWGVLPGYLLWGAGLACLLSIIVTMGADMREVLELDMSPEELEGYQHNTAAIIEWNLTYAVFLVLLFLTLISFIAEGKANEFGDMPFVNFLMRSMTAWPAICIFVALIYALMQPLNKDYAKKLAHYRNQQRLGTVNPALKTQLQLKLVQGTRRILPSVLRAIVRPLMPCKVIGKEHVDVENGPVVFVCNHLEIYGPIITNLHLPFYFRSWIISRMLDREVIAEHLTSGINIVFHWVPEKIRAKLPGFVAPIVLYILQSLDPIPVYRGTMREVIKTIQLSVDAMEYEDNILLFPENPGEGQYKLEGVSQFYSGFVTIGAEYYKRTGNATTFYPMYVNRAKRTLTIGEGIRYDTENSKAKEKDRIVEALHNWMEAQAPAEE